MAMKNFITYHYLFQYSFDTCMENDLHQFLFHDLDLTRFQKNINIVYRNSTKCTPLPFRRKMTIAKMMKVTCNIVMAVVEFHSEVGKFQKFVASQ